jgi:DNA polymerase I-like protein with 3'-5' exonuclease and polymerase domains
VLNQKYNLVDTLEKLQEFDRILMDGDTPRFKLLGYDTETNGLQLYKTTIVGFSISFDQHSGFYIPILEWVPDESTRYDRSYEKVKYSACKDGKLRCIWTGEMFDEFVMPHEFDAPKRIPFIIEYLRRWLTKVNLVEHNAPFDTNHTLINFGVDLKDVLFVDTSLLLHVLNENERTGLKQAAERYRVQLGINPHAMAAIEKKEMDTSIIENGGKPGMVWRASLFYQSKYACADTFLMLGIYFIAIQEFAERFGERGLQWFFVDEVMPVCKEVVMDMKRRGVYVDVPYFQKLFDENAIKMRQLEEQIMAEVTPHLGDFTLGSSVEEAISHQRIVKRIIELEGLKIPVVVDKKTGVGKESLAKAAVKKEFENNPHWVWGYILGEDELKYSDEKMAALKSKLYEEVEGRRYRFNIGSRDHLTWLFCDKFGMKKEKLPQTDSATKANPIPSMGAEVLQEFMLPKFPWVRRLMTYKKLQKLQSTYILPALELHILGWLYMDMKQNGTTSGRFSCSGGYNLQTLPRVDDEMEMLQSCSKCFSDEIEIVQELECIADLHCKKCGHVATDITRPSAIKKGFIAPPGYKIINADYASLEPRCFAFVSGEEKLKEVYWADLDLYSKVYCDIFDVKKEFSADPKAPNFLKKLAKAKRSWIKPIVLGIPYGAEDDQVANLIGAMRQKTNWKKEPQFDDEGKPIMVADAVEGKRVRDAYLNTYPKLRDYMAKQDEQAVTVGYVETLLGRRRHLPFAKKINDVLAANDIEWRDLTEAPIWELRRGMTVNYTSFRGSKVSLTEAMMMQIQEAIKFKDDSMREGGYWAYIRAMLRGDLNNAKNNPIQGLAGHIANKGMLDTNRKLRALGYQVADAWVCLQVHDEITGYAKTEIAEPSAGCLRDGMEKNQVTALLDVVMIADPVICDNLKESK